MIWRTKQAARLCGALTAIALLAGCNIVGPAFVLVHGPPAFPAEYKLDEARSTVLFIDDRAGMLPSPTVGQHIADVAQTTMLEKNLVDDLIDARGTHIAARQESHDKPLSLQAIGRAVKADVLIWVGVDSFVLSPDGQTFSPNSVTRIKIIDVATGERIWPEEPEGFRRVVRMPIQQGSAPTSRAELLEAQRNLASWTGVGVAQLFFKREVTEDRGRG